MVGGLRPLTFPVARRAPLVRPSMSARWLEGSRDAREPREPSLDPPCQDRVLACPIRSGRAHRSGTPSVVPPEPVGQCPRVDARAAAFKRVLRRGFAHPFALTSLAAPRRRCSGSCRARPGRRPHPEGHVRSGPEMRLGRRCAIHEFSMTEHPLTMRLPACLEGRRWTRRFTALARFGSVARGSPTDVFFP